MVLKTPQHIPENLVSFKSHSVDRGPRKGWDLEQLFELSDPLFIFSMHTDSYPKRKTLIKRYSLVDSNGRGMTIPIAHTLYEDSTSR